MSRIALALVLMGALAASATAQVRRDPRGIPPGQLPAAGECRVWYEGRPPGRQPRSTSCREAERVAARDARARVIYGRAIPRPGGRAVYANVGFETGYEDGYDKGRDDARDNDRYDPARHGRFRSADHRYERRYGSKVDYQRVYRDGFRAGYRDGYRDNDAFARDGRGPGNRLPWPF